MGSYFSTSSRDSFVEPSNEDLVSNSSLNQESLIVNLPDTMLLHILSFLAPEDLCLVSQTCRVLRIASEADSVWKQFAMPGWNQFKEKVSWKSRGHYKANYLEWVRRVAGQMQRMPSFPSSISPDFDLILRIILLGDSGVGKSSLLRRYTDYTFEERYCSGLGIDFKVRTIEVEGKIIQLQIWDTAGQERFREISKSYYRNAHGTFLLYDVTDPNSFKDNQFRGIPHWMEQLRKNNLTNESVTLIGAKCDLESQVSPEEAKSFAKEHNIPFWIETSAKNNINVDQVFLQFAQQYKHYPTRQTIIRMIPDWEERLSRQTVENTQTSACNVQ